MNTQSNNTNPTSTNDMQSGYHELRIKGVGFINDIREVQPRGKGKPFVSVRIAAQRGEKGGKEKTYINANVFGDDLKALLLKHADASKRDSGTNVWGQFTVSDVEARSYEGKDGNTVPHLYGRLFAITSLYVGGEEVFSASKERAKEEAESLGGVEGIEVTEEAVG